VAVNDDPLVGPLARLRAEFDASFGAKPRAGEDRGEAMLLLRIGEDPFAVRAREITGLLACRNIVALPSRAPDLVGIVGIRGAVVPVFSLARLIGYAHDPDPPRWLLMCGPEPLAISFGRFERHLRAPVEALHQVAPGGGHSQHVRQLLIIEGTTRPVVSVESILHLLMERNVKESRS
jgi:purine-binding chemotaxis protein CheW